MVHTTASGPVSAARIHAQRRGQVALISIEHPPVNALSHAVRSGLLEAVIAAQADGAVRALVIHGVGKHFVAGADIREFDHEPRAPLLNDVLLRIEASAKPIVAALHGSVLGGGFELALACHYRIAAEDATLGLPEIRLGLLPGSGGTQRLPRVAGASEALRIMLSGEPIERRRALELGIVDRAAPDGDLLAAACEFANELAARAGEPRRLRSLDVAGGAPDAEFVAQQRAAAERKYPGVASVRAIIECVDAAVRLPFDEALALSRRLFEECRASDASRALRHLFFAERGAKVHATAREVRAVGVLGAGTMGAGIAISLASAGFEVLLVDTEPRAVRAGLERVQSTLAAAVEKGRIDAATAAAATARVKTALRIEALGDAELVIEAVYESLAVKQEVFARLAAACRPDTVLATNTSTLDVDAIAAASGRPPDVVGMHFFSPANIMRLVEIVRGQATSRQVVATAQAVARRMNKLGIVVGNCFGFVGNRMLYAYGRENQLLLLEGATPSEVDAALEGYGMAMGPNAVSDLAGLDVGYRVRRERKDRPTDPRYYRVADLLVEADRLGQKSGRGAYLYPQGSRRRVPDPEVESMIAAESARLGIERRTIAAEEIRERCLFALINEGARILGEGIAASPGDIDAIWCNGYGFPRFRGGPMFYADTIGAGSVLGAIHRFAQTHGREYWAPAPLLEEIAATGITFQTWQARRAPGEKGDT
jgi:3-hydroxyacyl-CoA dehydrogenase